MRRSNSGLLASVVAGAMFACGPTSPGVDGGGGGNSDGSSNPNVDAAWITDSSIPPDSSCGSQEEPIELISNGDPPDLLIVLDRSGSMNTPPGLFPIPGQPTKWQIMKQALSDIMVAKENNINFGLVVFPSVGATDPVCGVTGGVDVPIAAGNATAINNWLGPKSADGNTPAHLALGEALNIYNGLPVNDAGRYVLFATDGLPNCGGDPPVPDTDSGTETVNAVTALASAPNNIPTYVLGFGVSFLGLPVGVLDDAALAGGVPKPGGPPHYYSADNATELEQALNDIAGGIIVPSCEWTLASQPPDPDLVTVTIDGNPVPKDPNHQNGWDYYPDGSTITFFGSYCSQIESGSVGNVKFTFGCPGPVVP